MPSSLTYPGVYVEELPSGVRTITGVATSVTAFVGRARKGPIDKAIDITSYADFERTFGGLWQNSSMSFAVRDFFLNGGARAVIVRLFHSPAQDGIDSVADAAAPGPTGKDAKKNAHAALTALTAKPAIAAATAAVVPIDKLTDLDAQGAIDAAVTAARATASTLPSDARVITVVDAAAKDTVLKFQAASPGQWAGYLRIQVEAASGPGLSDIAKDLKVDVKELFNLTAVDLGPGGSTETFPNVTLAQGCVRRVDKVLAATSRLIVWGGDSLDGAKGLALPDLTKVKGDALATASATLLAAIKDNPGSTVGSVKTAKDAADKAFTDALASVNDGGPLTFNEFVQPDGEANKKGLFALEQLYTRDGIFNLLCIAPYKLQDVEPNLVAVAAAYCEKRRAMLLVDAPSAWNSVGNAVAGFSADADQIGYRGRNAALFFPRLMMANPLHDNQIEPFAACGAVAGLFARTDTQRGVWKSPAGLDASFNGVSAFTLPLTDDENGMLNPLGINCLRTFPVFGRVLWGARTLRGADAFSDEYKYTAVRRTALYIEESLYRALKWVVFEPNDEPLWSQIRLNVGAFMHDLYRKGAFQGGSPKDAYFVKCDKESTTQSDINLGIVNIVVGFAPLKPAEFVVIKLQQMAGQIDV